MSTKCSTNEYRLVLWISPGIEKVAIGTYISDDIYGVPNLIPINIIPFEWDHVVLWYSSMSNIMDKEETRVDSTIGLLIRPRPTMSVVRS